MATKYKKLNKESARNHPREFQMIILLKETLKEMISYIQNTINYQLIKNEKNSKIVGTKNRLVATHCYANHRKRRVFMDDLVGVEDEKWKRSFLVTVKITGLGLR